MKKRKQNWKFIGVIFLLILYLGILFIISNGQDPYHIELNTENTTVSVKSSQREFNLPIKISNHANRMISSAQGFNLDYHLFNEQKELISYENQRSNIPTILATDSKVCDLNIIVPQEIGVYYLQVDLVEEGVTWLSDKNKTALQIKVIVE